MKLSIVERSAQKKSDAKALRRSGQIPAVLYGGKETSRPVAVKEAEFQALLRAIPQQQLATTVIEIGNGQKVLVKEVQYHPTTYALLHIDFFLVSDQTPVRVNVPIQVLGGAECVGVKLGGFVRQVIYSLKVSCLLQDLPKEFTLDVQSLAISEVKRLSDIAIPEKVRPLAKMGEVAVVIAKKV